MKTKIKWIIIAVVFIGVIIGASLLYNKLSGNYSTIGFAGQGNNSGTIVADQQKPEELPDESKADSPEVTDTEHENESTPETEETKENETEAPETEEPAKQPTGPDFTAYDKDGNPVNLSDYRGKPIVMNFWTTWCYYCELEMPDFQRAHEDYPDVQFLMINVTDGVRETFSGAKRFIEKSGYTFDVLYDLDRSAVRAYGVSSYPATILIDEEGNFVARANGMLNYDIIVDGLSMITDIDTADTDDTDTAK